MKKNRRDERNAPEKAFWSKEIKKKIAIVGSLILVMGFVVSAMFLNSNGVNAISQDQAKEIAEEYVPESASFESGEEDDDGYEFKWLDEENLMKYKVKLASNGEVTAIKSEKMNYVPSDKVVLSKDDVKGLFFKEFPKASIDEVNLDEDDGAYRYVIRFKDGTFNGLVIYDVEDGELVYKKLRSGETVLLSLDDDEEYVELVEEKGYLDANQVKEIALKHVEGAEIEDISLESDDDIAKYGITLTKGNLEYELELDAKTGKMLKLNLDNKSDIDDDKEDNKSDDQDEKDDKKTDDDRDDLTDKQDKDKDSKDQDDDDDNDKDDDEKVVIVPKDNSTTKTADKQTTTTTTKKQTTTTTTQKQTQKQTTQQTTQKQTTQKQTTAAPQPVYTTKAPVPVVTTTKVPTPRPTTTVYYDDDDDDDDDWDDDDWDDDDDDDDNDDD